MHECRMEAVPSVPFHERAPDLMKEEDIKNNQLEAEESANRLQGSCWQPPRDIRESLLDERQQRADISYRPLPNGEAQPIGTNAKRQSLPSGSAADGEASGVPSVPSSAGMLLQPELEHSVPCCLSSFDCCFAQTLVVISLLAQHRRQASLNTSQALV